MLFFDFEVFRHDWLMVAIDEKLTETVIANDKEALERFHAEHEDDLWVGYNCRNYDRWILKGILCGFDPYEINDWIIVQGRKGWEFSDVLKKVRIHVYDVFNGFHGLKTLEAFMGHDIEETSVPFNIDRKLTEDEIAETVHYCRHDVQETIEVFLRRANDFKAHMELLKSFGLSMDNVSKSRGQLIATILGAERKEHEDEFDLRFPDTLRLGRYQSIKEWYEKPENREYGRHLDTVVAGVPHSFAWGGVHGAIPRYHSRGKFLMVDVASLYPSLMIQYDFLSRNVREASRYKEIYEANLEMKRTHDPRRPAYKLVCNTTYGCMKDRYNGLYDPLMANNVCVGGQLLLLDLMEKIEDWCEIIQSNTDGLLIKVDPMCEQVVRARIQAWEERTRLHMEYTEFSEVWQKDVNNYVAIEPSGGIKCKGAYVKKLGDLDNDLPIVNEAVRLSMVQGIPAEDTIMKCDDLMMFQKVVHVSSKYAYATWNGRRMKDKTFRVFASTDLSDGPICKVKREGGTQEKFANTPERCFVDNGDVREKKADERLDKRWYVMVAESRAKEFGA